MRKRKSTAKTRPGADLLAAPGMEGLADLTKQLLQVPKTDLDKMLEDERMGREPKRA
jgi:hypothetical protein